MFVRKDIEVFVITAVRGSNHTELMSLCFTLELPLACAFILISRILE